MNDTDHGPTSNVSTVIVHLKDGTYRTHDAIDGYTVIVRPDGTIILEDADN